MFFIVVCQIMLCFLILILKIEQCVNIESIGNNPNEEWFQNLFFWLKKFSILLTDWHIFLNSRVEIYIYVSNYSFIFIF